MFLWKVIVVAFFILHAEHGGHAIIITDVVSTSSFRAASVEFVPAVTDSGSRIVARGEALKITLGNAQRMTAFIKSASEENVDIIVFPEDGLYGSDFMNRDALFPFLEETPVIDTDLCGDEGMPEDSPLTILACAARKSQITVVADVGLYVPCNETYQMNNINSKRIVESPNCPSDGRFQFNSQIAISPKGTLLAIYHKSHLFPEDDCCFDSGNGEVSTFPLFKGDTFITRIGMFICFDIFFHDPLAKAARDAGVSHFVFSTYFVNNGTDPFRLTALALMQGMSRALDVSVIGSNVGTGDIDSGSGIFARGGVPLKVFFNDKDRFRKQGMIIADVPLSSNLNNDFNDNIIRNNVAAAAAVVADSRRRGSLVVSIDEFSRGSVAVSSADGSVKCVAAWDAASIDTETRSAKFYIAARSPSDPFFGTRLKASVCSFTICSGGVNGTDTGDGGSGCVGHGAPLSMESLATFNTLSLTARTTPAASNSDGTVPDFFVPIWGNGRTHPSMVVFEDHSNTDGTAFIVGNFTGDDGAVPHPFVTAALWKTISVQ